MSTGSKQWFAGSNPETGLAYHTAHTDDSRKRETGCPPPSKCCDELPESIIGHFWAREGGSGGEIEHICEQIGLNLDPIPEPDGSRKYQGTLTDPAWDDYVQERTVTIWCNNINQIPGEDDCITAITAVMDGVQLGRDTCCCRPFCFAGETSANRPPAPENTTIGGWFYEIDDDGMVGCRPLSQPSICPSEPPVKPCGEVTDQTAAIEPVITDVQVFAVDGSLEGADIEATIEPVITDVQVFAVEGAVAAPPEGGECCEDAPGGLPYQVWYQHESPGGGGAVCCGITSGTLSEVPQSNPRAWSDEFSFSNWQPSRIAIRLECAGEGDSPSFTLQIRGATMPILRTSCTPIAFAVASGYRSLQQLGIFLRNPEADCPGEPGQEGDVSVAAFVKVNGAVLDPAPNACGIS